MPVEFLLEEDATKDCADGAVERGNGDDNSRVARCSRRVEGDDVADGCKRTADRGTEHHHDTGLGADRLPNVPELPILSAHHKRPDTAEQVVEASGERGEDERNRERAEGGVAVAPRSPCKPVSPDALGLGEREKRGVEAVAYAGRHRERNAAGGEPLPALS